MPCKAMALKLSTVEAVPADMDIVEWWGVRDLFSHVVDT